MTNEDLKKLAEEVLGGEYFIHPTGVFQMIKDDILNRIENALQKVRDETIEECITEVNYVAPNLGMGFNSRQAVSLALAHLKIKDGTNIQSRALKEKKE